MNEKKGGAGGGGPWEWVMQLFCLYHVNMLVILQQSLYTTYLVRSNSNPM